MEELTKQVSKMGETLNKVLENQEYMRNDISKMQEEMQDGFSKVNKRIDKVEYLLEDGFITTKELIKIANNRLDALEQACGIKPLTKISL